MLNSDINQFEAPKLERIGNYFLFNNDINKDNNNTDNNDNNKNDDKNNINEKTRKY